MFYWGLKHRHVTDFSGRDRLWSSWIMKEFLKVCTFLLSSLPLCNIFLSLLSPTLLSAVINKYSHIAVLLVLVSLGNRTAGRRGRQIACAWRTWQGYNLRILSWSWLTSMFSGLLQKDLFKRKWSLEKSYFMQNYCHACHTRFTVFFPLPSCYVSSLLAELRARSAPAEHHG